MKRALFAIGVFVALILIGALVVWAQEDDSTLVIRPSTMKDGETKTFSEDGRKITVRRHGDAFNIEVEGAEQTRRLTIVSSGEGDITIHPEGEARRQLKVIGPGPRILIDGMPALGDKKLFSSENWFVCPKDDTMVRVPAGKEDGTYKCPIDGTTLEKKKGRGFTIWMGENFVEGTAL